MSRRSFTALVPAAVLFLGLAAPATSQDKMEEGVWTGTVFMPDGEMLDLFYDVSYDDGGLAIELILPPETGMGTLFAESPMYEAETLVFTLDVGEAVSCSLTEEDDGRFEGECMDSSGVGALMTMFPPEEG